MNFFYTLTAAVCALAAAHMLLGLLAPDRYRREIKAILTLAAVAAIAGAYSGADFSEIAKDFPEFSRGDGFISSDSLVKRELEEKIADYISSFLEEEGISCKKITVRADIDGERRISITEASLELDEEYREREPYITALIRKKIGDIEINFYGGDG